MSFDLSDQKPLLHYSEDEERAHFFDSDNINVPMPRKTRIGKKKKSRKVTGVRIQKGRLALRVKGYKGVQRIAPAQLVRFIALSKLKVAAKKVLQHSGGKKKLRKKRKVKKK
jgi:hypothetical protein